MSLYFIVSSFFVFFYLIIQTSSDVKTKKVYKNLNYFAMLVIGLSYVVKCFTLGMFPQVQYFVGSFLFLVIHSIFLRKWMGTGDAKALVVMYYQSSLMYDDVFTFDLFFPAFIYFLATILFSFAIIIDGIKKKKSFKDIMFGKERRAFFPFLLPAYAINLLLCALSTPI